MIYQYFLFLIKQSIVSQLTDKDLELKIIFKTSLTNQHYANKCIYIYIIFT